MILLFAGIFWGLPLGIQVPEAGGQSARQSARPRILSRNQGGQVPMSIHPWGNFEVGAWRTSRTVVEKLEPGRTDSRATTENRVTLLEKGRTLKLVLESQISLMGRSVRIEPKQTEQDIFGISGECRVSVRALPRETLVVEGQPVHCDVVLVESTSMQSSRRMKLWYNSSRVPYVFRREVRAWNPQTGIIEETTSMNVTSMNLQTLVLGKMIPGYRYVQTSHFRDYSTKETVLASVQVPGAVVTRISQDMNPAGQVIQTVTVELLGYGRDASDLRREFPPGGAVRASRVAGMPTPLAAGVGTSVKRVEFSLEFSKAKESEPVQVAGSSYSADMARFHDRWVKSRVSGDSQEMSEGTFPVPDFDADTDKSKICCYSPVYNGGFRQSSGSRNGRVISTESLRLLTRSGSYSSSSEGGNRSEGSRSGWRRHWRSLWFADSASDKAE
ncbi:MAG: hypothetical protein Q4D98_06320 [Planctomycetia bacterium]|nr:hypothetical protein [Planctomycetia bacterium]